MRQIQHCALDRTSLLARYSNVPHAHTDCYYVDVAGDISLPAYIIAFFSTWVFRIERRILILAGAKSASDDDLHALADGGSDHWAAWRVEDRVADQILLKAGSDVIRTWLRVAPIEGGKTRLFFGSGVLPDRKARDGSTRLGYLVTALMGFHKAYSRVLLWAVARRLSK